MLACAGGVCELEAEEPASIRRLTLPLEQLNRALTPDWQTLTRTELERLLESQTLAPDGPRNSTIVQAEYTATITDDRIHSGKLSADIQHPDSRAALLVLDPLNLTMTGIRWQAAGPAAWGSTPSGRTAVLVNRPRGTLAADWTLQGRRLSRSVEFDIQIAPASVSRLVLKLDQKRGLRSSAGQVTRSHLPSADGTHTWTISLGRETGCRLTVDQSSTQPSTRPLILADRSLRYSVRDEGVRIQADFQLNVINGSIQQLQMSLPAQITVYAITYGTDTKLSWKSMQQGAVQKLNLRLPDELSGSMRPLRVEGFARVELEKSWELPQITMADTVFRNGQVVLDVVKPLTVHSFNAQGLQQTKAVMDAANQESFTFQQYLRRSHLQAVIGLPNQIASATVFTHFDLSGDDWNFSSAVNWLAPSGTQFRVGCQIAPGWKITDVAEPVSATDQKLVYWNTQLADNGELILSLEFADALDPKTPRTIVIRGERTAGMSLHHFQLPTVFPTSCQRVDSAIAISPAKAVSTREQRPRSFRRIQADSFPEFATESNLWQELSGPLDDTLFLTNESVDFQQPSIIDVGKATSAPQATVEAHLDARQIVEQFKITPDRQPGEPDRILVFLTAPGPAPKWIIQGAPSGPLACRQIPFDQLKNWSLPPGGELWEITLPAPQFGPVTILGIRTRPTHVTTDIALPFLPDSDSFRGRAALMFTDAAGNVTVDQTGLQSQPLVAGDDARDTNVPIAQRWSYTTAEASLAARRKAAPAIQQVATMSLTSHIVDDREASDIHLALFHLQGPTSTRFRFTLPEPAQLISTEVNGRNADSRRDGDQYVLTALSPDTNNSVAIRYRTPGSRSLIRTKRRIVVPRVEQNVIRLHWSIALPDGMEPIRTSPSLRLLDQPTEITWTQRLFGNLGRAKGRHLFDPLTERGWQTALMPQTVSESPFPALSDPLDIPSGAYSQWTVIGNMLPGEMSLVTVDSRQCRQCSWIALLGGTVVVLLMRVQNFRFCGYVVGLWITGCLVTAALATPEMSLVVGSSLTGVVIAGLLPQSILQRLKRRRSTRQNRMASTVQLGRVQHTSLLLCLLLCGWESLAQEITPLVDQSQTINPSRDILLPQVAGDETQQPQVAYVHQTLLRKLRDNLSTLSETHSYLIQSSRFDCDVRGASAIINARFQVVILGDQPELRIHLPITGANVGGSDACRVNGQPTPILKSTTRPGYDVIVSRKQTRQPISQPGANPPPLPNTLQAPDSGPKSPQDDRPTTPVPARGNSAGSTANPPTTVEIELALYPPTKAIPGGAMFELDVPPVMAAVMDANFDREYAFVSFSGSARTAGGTPTDAAGTPNASKPQPRQLTVDVGKRRRLWLRWSTTEPEADEDAVIESSVHCMVDIAPSRLQYDYTFDFQARSTELDYLTFQLPSGSRVLSVDSEQLLSFTATPQPTHEQLLVEFTQAQTANFTVSVSLILPLKTSGLEVTVPCTTPLMDATGIEVLRRVVQMSSQPPFELQLKTAPPSSRLLDQQPLINGRKSDYAFEISQPAVFTFMLERRQARRRVSQTQEAWIGAQRIDWLVSAEIETDETPAFQHTLWLDPRLVIESVSVIEDGAERMVRFNREGDRLTLFLSSKTTGLQNLTLTAHLPRNSELSTRLPSVRLLEAVTLESYLTLSHAEDLSVDILDPQHLKPDERKTPQTSLEAETLIGRYVLADSDKMPRIQTTKQQTTAIADTFTILRQQQQQTAWQVSTLVHFRPDSSRRRLKIRVPSVLKAELQIDSTVELERQLVDEPDGATLLLIAPQTDFQKAIDVTISAPVNIPPDGQWELPQLTLVDCQRGDRLIGLPEDGQLMLAQAESTGRQITSPPEWAQPLLASGQKSSNLSMYRVRREPTQPLLLEFAASKSTTHLISLVTTHLQLPDSQRVSGQTTIYVASLAANHHLRLQLPSATTVRAVVINGTTYVKPIKHTGSILEISLDDVTTDESAVVDLFWTRGLASDVALLAQIPVSFPSVTGASPGQNLLLLDQPTSRYCATRDSLRRLPPTEYLLRQSTGLLDVCRLQSVHKDRDKTAWRRLVAIQSSLGREWGFAGRNQIPLDNSDDVDRQRWNEIQAELILLQQNIDDATLVEPPDNPAALSPLAPRKRAILASLPENGSELSLWIVNVRNVLIVCLLLVIPLCVWLVNKLLHTKMARWLMSQPGTSALLLGTVWWLALEPSVLGLPLAVLGGARMIQHLTRPVPAAAA